MSKTKIMFTTAESKTKLTQGKICYRGSIIHNEVLSVDETRQAFADFARLSLPEANMAIDNICYFIADQVAKGNRLDFGGFTVSLALRGGIKSNNATFDSAENSLVVKMNPGKRISAATQSLLPTNEVSQGEASIYGMQQHEPKLDETEVLDAEGTRKLMVACTGEAIDISVENGGIRLEDDAGNILYRVTEIEQGEGLYNFKCTFTGSISKGRHWLFLRGRSRVSDEFMCLKRRLTVR